MQGGSLRQARVRQGTLLLLLTGGALLIMLVALDPFKGLQLRLSDTLFRPGTQPQSIVLAEVDDKSLEARGRFETWPRTFHAQAVDNLSKAGARVIVFDLLFVEPSPDDVA